MIELTPEQTETLAKLAYEAHRDVLEGQRLGPWEHLPSLAQIAWRAVARSLARALPLPNAPARAVAARSDD